MIPVIRRAEAVKVAGKKIKVLGAKALNSNLEMFCGDMADAYKQGVEEAQGEIVMRLQALNIEYLHIEPVPSLAPQTGAHHDR